MHLPETCPRPRQIALAIINLISQINCWPKQMRLGQSIRRWSGPEPATNFQATEALFIWKSISNQSARPRLSTLSSPESSGKELALWINKIKWPAGWQAGWQEIWKQTSGPKVSLGKQKWRMFADWHYPVHMVNGNWGMHSHLHLHFHSHSGPVPVPGPQSHLAFPPRPYFNRTVRGISD